MPQLGIHKKLKKKTKMAKIWTSLLCVALLAVPVVSANTELQWGADDLISQDRCEPAHREEIETSGIQDRDLIAYSCSDITEEVKSNAKILLQKNAAAKAVVDESIQQAERDVFIVPQFSLRKMCPERRYWQYYARLYYFGNNFRRCYSLTPVLTTTCTRRRCDFRTNFFYRSVCLNKYCPRTVWAICYTTNGVGFQLQKLRIWYRCCCSCYHLYYFDTLTAAATVNVP